MKAYSSTDGAVAALQSLSARMRREVSMDAHAYGRRDVLKLMTALAAAGFPALSFRAAAAAAYDPAAKFEVTVKEVELRRNKAGRMLMARIYQPVGTGPFPTILDLHGGAWNNKNRTAEEPMDRAL